MLRAVEVAIFKQFRFLKLQGYNSKLKDSNSKTHSYTRLSWILGSELEVINCSCFAVMKIKLRAAEL